VRALREGAFCHALKDADGSQRAAAQQLGMSYDQFRHHKKTARRLMR